MTDENKRDQNQVATIAVEVSMKTFILYRLSESDELFAISVDGIAVDVQATFAKVFQNLAWDAVKLDRIWVSGSVVPDIPIWRHVSRSEAVSLLS